MSDPEVNFPLAQREIIAETQDLRVQILTLAEGQCVPWHYHSNVTDTFFCMEGPMQVRTRKPDAVHELEPGGTCTVDPCTVHRVAGVDDHPCKFMLVQGVGTYDYVPTEAEDA